MKMEVHCKVLPENYVIYTVIIITHLKEPLNIYWKISANWLVENYKPEKYNCSGCSREQIDLVRASVEEFNMVISDHRR